MRLKSQSAMEYLMTYGWAILIIAVVIAVLFDLGIFSSPSFGNSCITQDGFYCSNPILTSSGALYVNFAQFSSGQMNITGFGCSNSTAAPAYFQDNFIDLQPNEQSHVMFPCPTTSGASGTQFIGTLWVKYNTPQVTNVEEEVASIKAHVAVAQIYYTTGISYMYPFSEQTDTYKSGSIPGCRGYYYISPDGSKLFQTYFGEPFCISSTSGYSLATLNLQGYNVGGDSGFSNSGEYTYVFSYLSSPCGGDGCIYLNKIDTNNYQVVENTLLLTQSSSSPYVITNDAKNIYFAADSNIYAVNKDSLEIVANVPGCYAPANSTISPDGRYVYFSCLNSGGVFVMNTQTYNTVYIPNTNSGDNAFYNVEFGQNGYAYALPYEGQNHIVVINTSTDNVVSTIPLYGNPGIDAVILSPTSKVLYVLGVYNGMLGIYSINTNTNTASNSIIPISCSDCSYYGDIAITPNGRKLLVGLGNTRSIYVVNLASDSVESVVQMEGTYTGGLVPAPV